jgi:hypothetical protein
MVMVHSGKSHHSLRPIGLYKKSQSLSPGQCLKHLLSGRFATQLLAWTRNPTKGTLPDIMFLGSRFAIGNLQLGWGFMGPISTPYAQVQDTSCKAGALLETTTTDSANSRDSDTM